MCGEKESECGCCGHDEPKVKESCCGPEEVCSPEGECAPKAGGEAPAEQAGEDKSAPDMVRDIVNFVTVKKEEETDGSTTCISDDTAAKLQAMLEKLVKKLG